MVRIDSRLGAFSVGDPLPGRIVELVALERLHKAVPALRGSALGTLPPSLATAPVVLYAPGPFTGEWARGARGLLAGALAMGVALRPEGRIGEFKLVLSGEYEPVEATARLGAAWDDLARSSLGRLLGLPEPLAPPNVEVLVDRVEMTVRLDLVPVVAGLRAAVAADVWEIMDFSRSSAEPARGPG
jgi:hypothetical protein